MNSLGFIWFLIVYIVIAIMAYSKGRMDGSRIQPKADLDMEKFRNILNKDSYWYEH